jgi:hypothetical protein
MITIDEQIINIIIADNHYFITFLNILCRNLNPGEHFHLGPSRTPNSLRPTLRPTLLKHSD